MTARLLLACGLLTLAAGAAGCESTQDKSARLAKQSGTLQDEQGLAVTKANPDVRVTGTDVVTDDNGSAVVVRLRNGSRRDQAGVPIALEVTGASGATVFTNATPGLERSLTHAALLAAGEETVWVNDQVFAAEPPKDATVKVGLPDAEAAPPRATLRTGRVRLIDDPVSGIAATGRVTNPGAEDVRRVLVSAVVEQGGKVVAAGRAIVPRVRAGKSAGFRVFFIGDPRKGTIDVTTTLAPTA
jgi:hypothetical protein